MRKQTMKYDFNFLNSKLLSFEIIENADWHIITEKSELESFLYSQTQVENCWLDLRENEYLVLDYATDEEKNWWNHEIIPSIEWRLKSVGYHDYLNDIEMDLFNCYLNIKHRLKNPLWNAINKAYHKGAFPCGYLGEFPHGKLVIFHPFYQPNQLTQLHQTMTDFFEYHQNLADNIEKILQFFTENAIIRIKGVEYIGKSAIEEYFLVLAKQYAEQKFLYHKGHSNGKDYFHYQFGLVRKTPNGKIDISKGVYAFQFENEHIQLIEISI